MKPKMKDEKPPEPFADALREALGNAKSLRSTARAAGISHPSLVHFMSGARTLRLDIADKLAVHFGFEVKRPRGKRK